MSGILGHSVYALLGLQAAVRRRLPVANIASRHFSAYLAGAYLGSDIQIVPAVTCTATGRQHGCCGMKFDRCPETGGPVETWRLPHEGASYTGAQIHALFYGRAHLIFGFTKEDGKLAVPWDHLADYGAAVVDDALTLFPPGERQLAYVFGWLVHVASDSLIKSYRDGVDLHMLDGKYTPRNRPVQDLYCCHEVGAKELKLDWPAVLNDLAATPVEAVQPHYMRVAEPRGRLAELFPNDWRPGQRPLLWAVLQENRRWFADYWKEEYFAVQLTGGLPSAAIRKLTGLDTYADVLALCQRTKYRQALTQIADAVASLFADVAQRSRRLRAV